MQYTTQSLLNNSLLNYQPIGNYTDFEYVNTLSSHVYNYYAPIDYVKNNYVNIDIFNIDISALNHNDIILSNAISNGITTLNSRITDNYNLLHSNFSPAEKITYALVGPEFINTIANMIEAYMIINLRSKVLTIENNNYLKSSNIVSSNKKCCYQWNGQFRNYK
jgi:hypothetical protein